MSLLAIQNLIREFLLGFILLPSLSPQHFVLLPSLSTQQLHPNVVFSFVLLLRMAVLLCVLYVLGRESRREGVRACMCWGERVGKREYVRVSGPNARI